MKYLSKIGLALLVAGVIAIANGNAVKTTRVDTIILAAWPDQEYDPDGSYHYTGLSLFNASSSSNAPIVQLPIFGTNSISGKIQLAEAMAKLSSVGFQVKSYNVSEWPYFINTVVMERESKD